MGVAASVFGDFQKATSPAFVTGPDAVLNEAMKRNYISMRHFVKGRSAADIMQGGRVIRDEIMFDEQSTAVFAHPDETFTWSQPQVLTEWEISWRYLVDHKAWNDQIVEQNITPGMTRSARHKAYKHLKRVLEQRMWTSLFNKIEDQLWAVPEVADMETASGKQPYSIPAIINEETNGLFYSVAAVTGKTAWTTVQGINPVTQPKWVPQQETYSSSAVSTGADNILHAFDKMWTLTKFNAPGTKDEYFNDSSMFGQFIACSNGGLNVYQQLLRDSQDRFVTASRQDPAYVQPEYAGVPVERVDTLGGALLYGAETLTNPLVGEVAGLGVGESNGPRYYWCSADYLKMVWHSRNYMDVKSVKEHPNQVFTHVQPVATWYNTFACSRQRLGIVSPVLAGDIYDAQYAAV